MSEPIRPADNDASASAHPAVPPPMDRRSFLVWAAAASLGASVLFMGATVVQAIMPPDRSIEGKTKMGKLAIAKVANLKVGVPVLAEYGDDVLFVIKHDEATYSVFDAACPHVRCKLGFNAKTTNFDCPCHTSSFTIRGKKIMGPAPRDMIPANFEIVGGDVVVSGIQA